MDSKQKLAQRSSAVNVGIPSLQETDLHRSNTNMQKSMPNDFAYTKEDHALSNKKTDLIKKNQSNDGVILEHDSDVVSGSIRQSSPTVG